MTSRSVAQMATASMRTSTSARFGAGTGFWVNFSSPGLPSTQARMVSGTGMFGLVFTPAGAYMLSPLHRRRVMRADHIFSWRHGVRLARNDSMVRGKMR